LFSKVPSGELDNEFANYLNDIIVNLIWAGTDTTQSALISMIDHLADHRPVVEFIRQKQIDNKLFENDKLDFEKLSSQT